MQMPACLEEWSAIEISVTLQDDTYAKGYSDISTLSKCNNAVSLWSILLGAILIIHNTPKHAF